LHPGQIVPGDADAAPKADKTVDLRKGAADVQAEKPQEALTEVELRFCPNCSTDLYNYVERPVAEEEKQRWLRYVMGEKRFTKVFKLFDDKVKITLRSRTLEESDAVFAQLKAEVKDGADPIDPKVVFKTQCYFLACCLQRVEGRSDGLPGGEDYPEMGSYTEAENGPSIVELYNKVIRPLPEQFVGVILKCLSDFDNLMTVLMNHSGDPDFWSPVGEDT
jgi:hypothetical protein